MGEQIGLPVDSLPSTPTAQVSDCMLSGLSINITVCICTFKRPQFLNRLLQALAKQETDGVFQFSIVVADNDALRSAESVVAQFAAGGTVPVKYCVQPQQNIALTRNKALENATGDFVAFIDDDEFPAERWLVTLFKALTDYKVDGVLGPVNRWFDQPPPQWVIDGNFYQRATYETGLVIDWRKGRTGNVLLKRSLFAGDNCPFRAEFRQGEDQEFFHRMIERGHRFIWCNEAVAYEVVPPIRWNRKFMLRRALLRGAMEPKTPGFGPRSVLKSLVAVPIYVSILPLAAVVGHHRFMAALISLCDHLGKLLAVLGLNPVREQYVTE